MVANVSDMGLRFASPGRAGAPAQGPVTEPFPASPMPAPSMHGSSAPHRGWPPEGTATGPVRIGKHRDQTRSWLTLLFIIYLR